MAIQHALQSDEPMTCRVIKRYSNRKLYDTKGSRYVTLLQIADMVRAGEEVQIIDNSTKEDKTEVTMALIISEQLKERPRVIPLATLKALIKSHGEQMLAPRDATNERPSDIPPDSGVFGTRTSNFGSGTYAATPAPESEPNPPSVPPPTSTAEESERQVEQLQTQIRILKQQLSELASRLPSDTE